MRTLLTVLTTMMLLAIPAVAETTTPEGISDGWKDISNDEGFNEPLNYASPIETGTTLVETEETTGRIARDYDADQVREVVIVALPNGTFRPATIAESRLVSSQH